MTAHRSRVSTLGRWLLALLLLAALAWGVGEMRADRGAKPEMGVGDLRQDEEPVAVEPRAPDETAASAQPRPGPGRQGEGDDAVGGTADEARAADR